jgi:hypothetical protein
MIKAVQKVRTVASTELQFRRRLTVETDPALATDVNRIVSELRRDGIAKVENFFPRERAIELGEELVKRSAAEKGDHVQVRKGSIRWNRVEDTVPELMTEFGNHPLIRAVSMHYMGFHKVFRLSFQESVPDPEVDRVLATAKDAASLMKLGVGRSWHFDTWNYALKAFVLLSDVTEENGPFVHVLGSHRFDFSMLNLTRLRLSWSILPPDPFDNSVLYLSGHQAETISRRRDIVAGTGPAGTLYFADTRGIHRGMALRTGVRRVLWNYLT